MREGPRDLLRSEGKNSTPAPKIVVSVSIFPRAEAWNLVTRLRTMAIAHLFPIALPHTLHAQTPCRFSLHPISTLNPLPSGRWI